jgi:Phage terminase, small subunit
MAGRKSAASLAVVSTLPASLQRPEPPEDLTAAQAEEWRAVVGRMPLGWFTRETHQVLATYCRHAVNARQLAALLAAFDPSWVEDDEGLKRYDKLLAMAEREGKAVVMTATRLRLTPQSRYAPDKAATATSKAGTEAKPWQKHA